MAAKGKNEDERARTKERGRNARATDQAGLYAMQRDLGSCVIYGDGEAEAGRKGAGGSTQGTGACRRRQQIACIRFGKFLGFFLQLVPVLLQLASI